MAENIEKFSISEIVAQTKHLAIKARKMVNSSLQSDYKSSFKGRGMEFDEVRAYTPGDNVRDIDWNVTARMNEPFIKTFIEERELQTYFIVDISASGDFGSVKSKRHLMAEITALLGFTSFFANDKTGLILSSDKIEKIIPPMHNYSHILRIIRDVFYHPSTSKKTDLNNVFRKANHLIKKKAIIFILSDFFDDSYEHALGTLSKKHEIIPIVITDPIEQNFTSPYILPIIAELEDMESNQTILRTLGKNSITDSNTFTLQYNRIFRKLGLVHATIDSSSNYLKIIDQILRKHTKH
ncbi:MAG: DUF58 domain-containing protein [Spirochaetota bacterium]|nr:DUF58 domain-containing protein [Spirochaetota bacterium]